MFEETQAAERGQTHRDTPVPQENAYPSLQKLAGLIKSGAIVVTFGAIVLTMLELLQAGFLASRNGWTFLDGVTHSPRFSLLTVLSILQVTLYGVLVYAAGEALQAFRRLVINSHRIDGSNPGQPAVDRQPHR